MLKASTFWYHAWKMYDQLSRDTFFVSSVATNGCAQFQQRPRIGFLVANLYAHSTGKVMVGLITELSNTFEVIVYLTKRPPKNDVVYNFVQSNSNVQIIAEKVRFMCPSCRKFFSTEHRLFNHVYPYERWEKVSK